MNTTEIAAVLEAHGKWLRREDGGRWADLSGAYLNRVDLSGANLSRANLGGANLGGANLSRANLSRANLSGANLSLANLSGANLSGANLSWANLSGANLSWANLSGANLSLANLSRANLGTWFIRQVGPVGSRGDTLVLLARPASSTSVEAVEEVRTGCFGSDHARTLAEFEAANEARTDGNVRAQEQYRRAIAWLRAEMAAAGLPEMGAEQKEVAA